MSALLFGYRPGAWCEKRHKARIALHASVSPLPETARSPKRRVCSECLAGFEVTRGEPLTCGVDCSIARKRRLKRERHAKHLLRHANLLGEHHGSEET